MNKSLSKEDVVSSFLFLEKNDIIIDVFTISVACAYISGNFVELKEKIDFVSSSGKTISYDLLMSLFSEYISASKTDMGNNPIFDQIESMKDYVSTMLNSNSSYNKKLDEELKKVSKLDSSLSLGVSMVYDSIEGLRNNYFGSEMTAKRFHSFLEESSKKIEEDFFENNKDFLTGLGNINYQRFVLKKMIVDSSNESQFCALITLKNDKDYEDKLYLSIVRHLKSKLVGLHPNLKITRVSRNSFMINFDAKSVHKDFSELKVLINELLNKEFIYKIDGKKVNKMKINVVLNQIYNVDEVDNVILEMIELSNKEELFISNCIIR